MEPVEIHEHVGKTGRIFEKCWLFLVNSIKQYIKHALKISTQAIKKRKHVDWYSMTPMNQPTQSDLREVSIIDSVIRYHVLFYCFLSGIRLLTAFAISYLYVYVYIIICIIDSHEISRSFRDCSIKSLTT